MNLEPVEELRAHAAAVTIALRLLAKQLPAFAEALREATTPTDPELGDLLVKDAFIASVRQNLIIFSGLPPKS